MSDSFKLSLAPDRLWQAINPWSFYNQGAQLGLINVDLGRTPRPDIEQKFPGSELTTGNGHDVAERRSWLGARRER